MKGAALHQVKPVFVLGRLPDPQDLVLRLAARRATVRQR
jgi:hypothetical protein